MSAFVRKKVSIPNAGFMVDEYTPLDHKCDTRIEARQGIFKFINLYYNTRQPHSSIGNLSPVEYERQCAH